MGVTKTISQDGKAVTIKINGNFDFNVHREFREAYRDASGPGQQYLVDLTETVYMDSSALGMLLLLREHAGSDGKQVKIVGGNAEIKKIFEISNFNRLFAIAK